MKGVSTVAVFRNSERTALIAVFLLSTLALSLLALHYGLLPKLRGVDVDESRDANMGHFSLVYRGFFPGDPNYKTDYPDYYIAINNLKSSEIRVDVQFQFKNQEDRAYYVRMQASGSPPAGWTLQGTLDIGLIAVDETKSTYYWMKRTRPTSIPGGLLTESVSVSIAAYRDSGYSDLYSQDTATITFHLIDRTSTAWIILSENNFDDGTVQGWSCNRGESYGSCSIGVSTEVYRSFGYSAKLTESWSYGGFQKSFQISGYQEAYMIFSLRSASWRNLPTVTFDGTVYFVPDQAPLTNVWYQFTIALPTGKTTTVTIWAVDAPSTSNSAYLDDVYVIAR